MAWLRGTGVFSLASQILRQGAHVCDKSTHRLLIANPNSSIQGISSTVGSLRTLAACFLTRSFGASTFSADGPPDGVYITLNDLRDNPGASKKGRRLGRGIGSSKGKTAGRGHKGQRARSGGGPKPGFEGGQTPLRLRVPKRGFHNPFTRVYQPLNLDRLKEWIVSGRLNSTQMITMKELRDSGAVRRRIGDGVKILGRGIEDFDVPVHLQVSQVSETARDAIQQAGGSVKTVYYNKLGLRALIRPEWFAKKGRVLPKAAMPPPKLVTKFEAVGELPPKREF